MRLIGIILGLVLAGAAAAHARLQTAIPPVGSTVAVAPADLRLTFNETIDPDRATVALTGEDGKDLGTGGLAGDPADPDLLIVKLPAPLAPGTYKVSWTVTTGDKAKTQGSYRFRVGP